MRSSHLSVQNQGSSIGDTAKEFRADMVSFGRHVSSFHTAISSIPQLFTLSPNFCLIAI
jgi:hypothetical protein